MTAINFILKIVRVNRDLNSKQGNLDSHFIQNCATLPQNFTLYSSQDLGAYKDTKNII